MDHSHTFMDSGQDWLSYTFLKQYVSQNTVEAVGLHPGIKVCDQPAKHLVFSIQGWCFVSRSTNLYSLPCSQMSWIPTIPKASLIAKITYLHRGQVLQEIIQQHHSCASGMSEASSYCLLEIKVQEAYQLSQVLFNLQVLLFVLLNTKTCYSVIAHSSRYSIANYPIMYYFAVI